LLFPGILSAAGHEIAVVHQFSPDGSTVGPGE